MVPPSYYRGVKFRYFYITEGSYLAANKLMGLGFEVVTFRAQPDMTMI